MGNRQLLALPGALSMRARVPGSGRGRSPAPPVAACRSQAQPVAAHFPTGGLTPKLRALLNPDRGSPASYRGTFFAGRPGYPGSARTRTAVVPPGGRI